MANEKYKTIQGDTWDLISFKIWGTEKHFNELIKENREHIGTVFFKANIELNVPQIEETNSRISPWR